MLPCALPGLPAPPEAHSAGKLSCQLCRRGAELVFGTPFDIGTYSLLTEMVAHQLSLPAGSSPDDAGCSETGILEHPASFWGYSAPVERQPPW
ncbi:thymidylate synthase [Microbacterium halotolerans]|uniref:thymidylate synthase n=1 Tax=Microbacterium halotolerans TaxID=246613 RepID=UPI000E6AB7D6